MTIQDLGSIGELIAAISTVITLVYLATQIKQSKEQISQSNSLARFNVQRDLLVQYNELNKLIVTDATLRQVLESREELTAADREQVYTYVMMFCAVWMSVQAAYDNGQLEEWFYESVHDDVLVEMNRWPRFRWGVEKWLSNYPQNSHLKIFQSATSPTDPRDDI
jgi:hypothetical protein